jgi:hypothetical protein
MDNLEFETLTDIKTLLADQKCFLNTGKTKDIGFRKGKLETLHESLGENEENVLNALMQDLSKSFYEGYLTEFGIIKAFLKSPWELTFRCAIHPSKTNLKYSKS